MDRLQAEAEAIEAAMAKALTEGLPAESTAVQALMRRHNHGVGAFWRRPPKGARASAGSTGSTRTSEPVTTAGLRA